MPAGFRSIVGRTLGITSTRGLGQYVGSTGGGSTALNTMFQQWGSGINQTVSAAQAAISNVGVTLISSDTTSGGATLPFLVGVPAAGLDKTIHFQTAATRVDLNTTSTTIFFNTSAAVAAAGGSTALTVTGSSLGIGGTLHLKGVSATVWAVMARSPGIGSSS